MAKHLTYLSGAAIDYFYEVETFLKEGDACKCVPLGKKIGGCVLNAATVSSRLGSSVKVVDYLRKNDEGTAMLLEGLKEKGVDTSAIRFGEDVINGVCLIMKKGDEKCIYVIEPKRPFFEEDEDLKEILFGSSYIYSLMHMVRKAFKDTSILREAKRHGARIVFDGSSQYREEYEKEMVLDLADAFFMNKEAYERFSDSCGFDPIGRMLERGAEFCCVTDGSRGASCYSKEGTLSLPAYKVNVVDSTGAGDSFAGAFLHFRSKGCSLEECMEYASACGAYACTKEGGMAGAITEKELLAFHDSLNR
ncbi:MAG: carbohydrate kinase family protein [Erysipelotrichaceae bacterium]|nr:carbohydrate kinase family protein [Erysipelotrichaceae bacterium]